MNSTYNKYGKKITQNWPICKSNVLSVLPQTKKHLEIFFLKLNFV